MTQLKKSILAVALVLFGVAFAKVGWYYWQNLRGIGPAISPPPEDITKRIPAGAPGEGDYSALQYNDTQFPLTLPEGVSVNIFAKNVPGARVLVQDSRGDFWVSQTREGVVSKLEVENGLVKNQRIVFRDLDNPHGLAFDPNDPDVLYIAQEKSVSRVRISGGDKLEKILDLASGGGHVTRTIAFGPDNRLYVSVGSSCNVCNEEHAQRASIFSVDSNGNEYRLEGAGLRNSVFFDWNPVDGALWATDNGRDHLGDNLPPDEVNIVGGGAHYGWPWCYGNKVSDASFLPRDMNKNQAAAFCSEQTQAAHVELGAHVAPLGMAFVPEEGWPQEWWYNLIVAQHGSWNRSVPTGYNLVRVPLDAQGKQTGPVEEFIGGWLRRGSALGRPVDVLIQPGGVMYVTDDKAGVVYRVTYVPPHPLVRVTNVRPNAPLGSPFTLKGSARGPWYFEANFPVRLEDEAGNILHQSYATAQGEWMTTDFVPFSAALEYDAANVPERGVLVLTKSNPSGLPEHDDEVRIPVRLK